MARFVIAGKSNCSNFLHVLHVADYLANKLPNFEVTKIQLKDEDWVEWIIKKNREFHWSHFESPLIYKELLKHGTLTPQFIGGISEFWEYCYDYYGLETTLTKEDVDRLLEENMINLSDDFLNKNNSWMSALTVMIYGAVNEMVHSLLPELMKVLEMKTRRQIRFLLYDESLSMSFGFFAEIIDEMRNNYNCNVECCDNLGDGLKSCNLLILIGELFEPKMDAAGEFDKSSVLQLNYLAEEINQCGLKSLRIVFANNAGPVCLGASLLADLCDLPQQQIVVVTSDLGLPFVAEIARRFDLKVEELNGAPVWGFTGVNQIVDYEHIVRKCYIQNPNSRSLKRSSLPQGTLITELRFVDYLCGGINASALESSLEERKKRMERKLERVPCWTKIRALSSLLRIWYEQTEISEPIISLGVFSDGSFGIPKGLVFSQPAILKNGGWVPFGNYPVEETIRERILEASAKAWSMFMKLLKSAESSNSARYIKEKSRGTRSYRSFHARFDSQMDNQLDFLRKGHYMF